MSTMAARRTSNANRPILLTGTSTGIGRHLNGYLAERGHTVYATARKESDLAGIGGLGMLSTWTDEEILELLECVH
jgi:short-subunit dehydrogenase involved in D-alanine esterification of teichoic acids